MDIKNSEGDQPKVLLLASVASMLDLFNSENIKILINLGCIVDVAANFQHGSITSQERVDEYERELRSQNIGVNNVPIPRSIFQVGDILRSYRMIKCLVNKENYNIVHCHSPIGGVIARLSCRHARKRGTKVIYTGHGLHFYKGAPLKNWLLFYPIERLCALYTDVIIAINQEDYLREKAWNCCNVVYVPGVGVNTAYLNFCNVNRPELRKQFGFTDDDFVFMSTGQISVRKNHAVIIRALKKIQDERVKYLIVGFGELEKQLKSLVIDLGLTKRVFFAGYRRDVRDILHAVDGFAFPSLQEGLPVALMEAMVVGLPVVCSRIRGNVDLIKNGMGGLVYDCHDVDGFAQGMLEIANGGCVKKMGLVNKETMKGFDISVVNSIMDNIYKGLLVPDM